MVEMSVRRQGVRLMDYIELMKPELTGLSVLTTVFSFYLASGPTVDGIVMLWTALGTLFVGGGAGALNQHIERFHDAKMKRTERRPLPAGRLRAPEVFVFGWLVSTAGFVILWVFANPLAAIIAESTLLLYLFVYTPLKRLTWLNTIVGAVPGALPTLIGCAAASNRITLGGWIFFGLLFAWQIPHFLSLAWMYRKDYARAGYKMLTVIDTDRASRTSLHILVSCAILIPLSVGFTVAGLTGMTYFVGAILVSGGFAWYSFLLSRASRQDNPVVVNATSRLVFFASLAYLPALMILMLADRI